MLTYRAGNVNWMDRRTFIATSTLAAAGVACGVVPVEVSEPQLRGWRVFVDIDGKRRAVREWSIHQSMDEPFTWMSFDGDTDIGLGSVVTATVRNHDANWEYRPVLNGRVFSCVCEDGKTRLSLLRQDEWELRGLAGYRVGYLDGGYMSTPAYLASDGSPTVHTNKRIRSRGRRHA